MEENLREVIKLHYSGGMTDIQAYSGLAVQTVGILVGGFILWRATALLHKRKKNQRRRNDFFETPYSKGWKRK